MHINKEDFLSFLTQTHNVSDTNIVSALDLIILFSGAGMRKGGCVCVPGGGGGGHRGMGGCTLMSRCLRQCRRMCTAAGGKPA